MSKPTAPVTAAPEFAARGFATEAGAHSSHLSLPEVVDLQRLTIGSQLDPKRRTELGQFMTPANIARFMVALFDTAPHEPRVLDPGAGLGSLTAAMAECLSAQDAASTVRFVSYEVDPLLAQHTRRTVARAVKHCRANGLQAEGTVVEDDFILAPPGQPDLFGGPHSEEPGFTHVIMNPPYRKITTASRHRAALRRAGLETSNLYAGFMFLAAAALRDGGELVAIVPRSFCNGPYFRPFRERFFSVMALRHVHLFDSRDRAFKDDDILQENIILHAAKRAVRADVMITASSDSAFSDMTERLVPHSCILRPGDPDHIVYLAANEIEQRIADRLSAFTAKLTDLGLEVSTGPVVDFRLRRDLRSTPQPETVPVLYPTHFRGGTLNWPKDSPKPNAIRVTHRTRKWLWPNEGNFVVTRRFTAKEERRRLVASVYSADLPGDLIGFENHLNVYHAQRCGLSRPVAVGLATYLNSTLVDRFFRQFNGHTQVNASDLRALRYPDREVLERIGTENDSRELSQLEIDMVIEKEINDMAADPLDAQRKIDEALELLESLGLPRGQQNKRSALTLLALVRLEPSGAWVDIDRPLMGITPIMDYVRVHYGQDYAPNTRETIRRQTMHQFVEAGVALYNPDEPDRPVNSPKACYQVSDAAASVIRSYGTGDWSTALQRWLEDRETLAARWAKHREMEMIPVHVGEDRPIYISPGHHSELIRQIIESFAPRFAPGAEIIYIGDTGAKSDYFQSSRLEELGVSVDRHGKMPDVVLYWSENNWLLLVEAVTSHGPVDPKRHDELATLFASGDPGLVYVTAFPTRGDMARYLAEISWETEVWCADAPSHLIHFDGEQFLGPYQES